MNTTIPTNEEEDDGTSVLDVNNDELLSEEGSVVGSSEKSEDGDGVIISLLGVGRSKSGAAGDI
jgi:hypothetical protein